MTLLSEYALPCLQRICQKLPILNQVSDISKDPRFDLCIYTQQLGQSLEGFVSYDMPNLKARWLTDLLMLVRSIQKCIESEVPA